jgi:hypothetical protein
VARPASVNRDIECGQRAELGGGESVHSVGHPFQEFAGLGVETFDSFH